MATLQDKMAGQQQQPSIIQGAMLSPEMRRQALLQNIIGNIGNLDRGERTINPLSSLQDARAKQVSLQNSLTNQEYQRSLIEQQRQQQMQAEEQAKRQAELQQRVLAIKAESKTPQEYFRNLQAAGYNDIAKDYAQTWKEAGQPLFSEEKDTRTAMQKNYEWISSLPKEEQQGAIKALKMLSGGTTVNVGGEQPMGLGAKQFHEETAKSAVDWLQQGRSNSLKNMSQLSSVLDKFNTGKDLTGGVVGITPDVVLAYLNSDALAAKEDVQQVVGESLKEILGAQFTEKEGERLMARAYNSKLPEEVNARRVFRLLKQLEIATKAKDEMAQYFLDNNYSMEGWNYFDNPTPTKMDFYAAIEDESLDPPGTQDVIEPRPLSTGGQFEGFKVLSVE